MNIFVHDEHTPAQAKKQAGRESFYEFLPARHCHHTAITNLPLISLFTIRGCALLLILRMITWYALYAPTTFAAFDFWEVDVYIKPVHGLFQGYFY